MHDGAATLVPPGLTRLASAPTMIGVETAIRAAETRLLEAMRTSDVGALDQLIHDRLRFIGPDGVVYSKEDDLSRHRSGFQRMTRIEVEKLDIEPHGDTAIAIVDTRLEGSIAGAPFAGRYRYLRVWQKLDAGWVIIAGEVRSLDPVIP
jgi:ketosteroid isomerase-like protein